MIKFQRFFFVVVVIFILIFHFEVICISKSKINKIGNVGSHSDLPHPNSFSWGGDILLEYNKFFAPHGIENLEVYWEFNSTGWDFPSVNINITVLFMSNTTFLNFNNSVNNIGLDNTVENVPYNNTIISEGKFSDSGYSNVSHRTVWYVIFANLDEDKLRSHLIFYTFYDEIPPDMIDDNDIPPPDNNDTPLPYSFYIILLLFILPIGFVVIIITVLVLYARKRKARLKEKPRETPKITKKPIPFQIKEKIELPKPLVEIPQIKPIKSQLPPPIVEKSEKPKKIELPKPLVEIPQIKPIKSQLPPPIVEKLEEPKKIEPTKLSCKFCGMKLNRDARFCPQCGTINK